MTDPSSELGGNRPSGERGPAWLIMPGKILLLALLLFASFSLGVYFGERDLTRAITPPWPEPRPVVTSTPTPTPVATLAPASWSEVQSTETGVFNLRADFVLYHGARRSQSVQPVSVSTWVNSLSR